MIESPVYDFIKEEGRKEGIIEGMKEGIKEGKKRRSLRNNIICVGYEVRNGRYCFNGKGAKDRFYGKA